jgi:hypothetical protein
MISLTNTVLMKRLETFKLQSNFNPNILALERVERKMTELLSTTKQEVLTMPTLQLLLMVNLE